MTALYLGATSLLADPGEDCRPRTHHRHCPDRQRPVRRAIGTISNWRNRVREVIRAAGASAMNSRRTRSRRPATAEPRRSNRNSLIWASSKSFRLSPSTAWCDPGATRPAGPACCGGDREHAGDRALVRPMRTAGTMASGRLRTVCLEARINFRGRDRLRGVHEHRGLLRAVGSATATRWDGLDHDSLSEALGMSLPGGAAIPRPTASAGRSHDELGARIVDMAGRS